MSSTKRPNASVIALAIAALALPAAAFADGGITFMDLAEDPASGLGYARTPSATVALVEDLYRRSLVEPVTVEEVVAAPMMPRGLPGVAILDYDRDSDLDLYVTNGPGSANSLFQSQLRETGDLWFVEVALSAGVDATGHDSFGTCFGDLDNDGDHDLVVLGRKQRNLIFENLGAGAGGRPATGAVTFRQVPESGAGGGERTSTSCSLGDVDGDGWLDLVVANSFDQTVSAAIWFEPHALNEHNQLFLGRGDLTFADASDSSGITVNGGYPPGAAGITWGTVVADVDRDGDQDVAFMDDAGAIPPARVGGIDRAFIHVFVNDGAGRFTDRPIMLDENSSAEWMGVSVGDLDCDGHLDLFASCFGDYGNALFRPFVLGASASRPFFGLGDGTFRDPLLGWGVEASVFGWGNAIFDYDADGDLDVVYHGGLDASNLLVLADNPGALLQNQGCSGQFMVDREAISTDHIRRNVRGVAVGDLDANGFPDVVTVASFRLAPEAPLLPIPAEHGSPFDETAFFAPIMANVAPPEEDPRFLWLGAENGLGDLAVELSSGNGNRSLTVDVVGGAGLAAGGRVNRDGIGAVLSFTPGDGPTAAQAVTGGSSHSSQHALDRVFGLGQSRRGVLEVLWPGGVRNRLYEVGPGRTVMPEIPCSFDGEWRGLGEYLGCVRPALRDYRRAGILTGREAARLLTSAILAFKEG